MDNNNVKTTQTRVSGRVCFQTDIFQIKGRNYVSALK